MIKLDERLREQPAIAAERRAARKAGLLLGLLLLGTLLKGALWAFLIFPFDSNDEPSHFDFVMQLRANGALPVVQVPDPNRLEIVVAPPQDAQSMALLHQFGYREFVAMPYESSQPPLFYATAAALLAPLPDNPLALLYAARLVAVLFGVGAVWALWWAVRALWPDQPMLYYGAPLALTLQAQFTFITAAVSNDAAIIFCGALLLAIWAAGLRAARQDRLGSLWRWGLLAGAATALGLLAKLTIVVTVPCTLLWLIWLAATQHKRLANGLRDLAAGLLAAGVAVLALAGWWIVHNLQVYGEPTGTRAIFDLYHRFALGLTPDEPNAGGVALFANAVTLTLRSFWATFSWMSVTLPAAAYLPLLLLATVALGCLLLRGRASGMLKPEQGRLTILAAVALLVAIADLVFFIVTVAWQPQGRYLFVAIAPAMLLITLGLSVASSNPLRNRLLLGSFIAALALVQLISLLELPLRWTFLAAEMSQWGAN